MRSRSTFVQSSLRFVALGAVVCACSGSPAVSPQPLGTQPTSSALGASDSSFPLAAEASRGIDNADLAALLREHWNNQLRRDPIWATSRGDHRFDTELADNSHQATLADLEMDRKFLARAKAISSAALKPSEATSLALFIGKLEADLGVSVCQGHLWQLSPFSNPVAAAGRLPDQLPVRSALDANNLLARYKKIPTFIERDIANLTLGASRGLFANAESVKRTLAQVDSVLSKPGSDGALMSPTKDDKALAALTEPQRKAWIASMEEVVNGPIKESFGRYRAFVAKAVQPNARAPEAVGVSALPFGRACYQARVARYLGIERTPSELHELGLAEIARINGEMKVLGNTLFGTSDLGAITTRLRTDPELYFKTSEEVVEAARAALLAATAKAPEYFGIVPEAACVVTPIPDFEAPFSTIAYYRGPHADGSVPGQYFVNSYKPSVRPRFEARVLAYHEAIPGHHLQIGIALERTELPAFRRNFGSTAFVEGWALYTERLSDEMGLYATDLDRMGMLSFDAWRAARLVVDTGIHSKGWTRSKAEEYMREHTALAGDNIVNEVDRYINWPGQALAYKVGQLWILELRASAKKALGDRFDIKAFHDVVLKDAAVSLPVLKSNVDAWIAAH